MTAIRIGTVIAGKYRLEAPIAQGGMGSVWAAHHLTLDKRLAIKFIGAEIAGLDEARKRFEREAKAAAVLQSPHVVQIHDYGVDGEVPYLVMELLEGEDLGARLARRGKLPPVEVVSVVTQVARALRRAAEAGFVHRDLKPGNIFVVRGDEDDELIKVLDFGIAKAPGLVDDDTTRTGIMVGSPRYVSPEQARGSRSVDHRSDLWSLAVIAYRALTGQLPFRGADVADLIFDICRGTAAPPSRHEPTLDPEMDAFFERALAREPDARFQSAKELALAFAKAAGEAPPRSISSGQLRAVLLGPGRATLATYPAHPPAAAPSSPAATRTVTPLEATRASPQGPASARAPEVVDRAATTRAPVEPRHDRLAPEATTPTTAAGNIEATAPRAPRVRAVHALIAAGMVTAALSGAWIAWWVAGLRAEPVKVVPAITPPAPSAAPSATGTVDRPAATVFPAPERSAEVPGVPASASASPPPQASAPAPAKPLLKPWTLGKKRELFGI
jgi:serine/threonine-protein kinase